MTPDEQLQDLYVLDRGNGDRRLAYYGQRRAVERTHEEAMQDTAEYFGHTDAPFWIKRMKKLQEK